jgi:hypothetical protein
MWFEQWLEWWKWLISSWHVMLESAKDQILGVDTSRQHVPPRVQYGMTCLVTRNVIGCVSCSIEWGMTSYFVAYLASYFVICLNHMVQEGPLMGNP